ncbi:MAG: thermonuclease family protein [Acidobacteria bacterium]|nr:thermonuclease family protein [Acidobacteriota bacterium]
MKIFGNILIIVVVLLLVLSAHAQQTLRGKVVDIVDGKTFVIETESGRVTGTIQYVEVPEPEQPLSRIVREHFQQLVLGKTIVFTPSGFSPIALAGKAYLGDLDLGQQLVRDGAAWHLPAQRSGQDPLESQAYENYEALAKSEKRGVWSIANLTPAWEFRARKDRSAQYVTYANASTSGKEAKNYQYTKENADMWVEVGGDALAQKNATGAMFWGYDADKKIRNVSTASIAQELSAGEKRIEVEVRAVYFQGEIKPRTSNTAYVLGILSTSKEHNFAKSNSLVFVADGAEITLGGGQRFWRENSASVQELVQYRIGRGDLLKIANSRKLPLTAGEYSGTVGTTLRDAILQLAEATK